MRTLMHIITLQDGPLCVVSMVQKARKQCAVSQELNLQLWALHTCVAGVKVVKGFEEASKEHLGCVGLQLQLAICTCNAH